MREYKRTNNYGATLEIEVSRYSGRVFITVQRLDSDPAVYTVQIAELPEIIAVLEDAIEAHDPKPVAAPEPVKHEVAPSCFLVEVAQWGGTLYKLDNTAEAGGVFTNHAGGLYKIGTAVQQVAVSKGATPDPGPATAPAKLFSQLSDQARLIFQHMRRAGSISAREAYDDYSITSATLARRICDIELLEGWTVNRERRVHPISQRSYTRYSLVSV